MHGEQISTEGPIHIYCSIHIVPQASHGKDQPLSNAFNFFLNPKALYIHTNLCVKIKRCTNFML